MILYIAIYRMQIRTIEHIFQEFSKLKAGCRIDGMCGFFGPSEGPNHFNFGPDRLNPPAQCTCLVQSAAKPDRSNEASILNPEQEK